MQFIDVRFQVVQQFLWFISFNRRIQMICRRLCHLCVPSLSQIVNYGKKGFYDRAKNISFENVTYELKNLVFQEK